jgi:hypothetical protein
MNFLTKYLLKLFLRKAFLKCNHRFAIREVINVMLVELSNWFTEDNLDTCKQLIRDEIELS